MGLALALLLACPGSRAQAQGPQGAELAGRLGCLACHALNGPGGKLAAPLRRGGGPLNRRGNWRIAIAYPRQRHPRAKMPSYAYLPPMEQAALVKFLANPQVITGIIPGRFPRQAPSPLPLRPGIRHEAEDHVRWNLVLHTCTKGSQG